MLIASLSCVVSGSSLGIHVVRGLVLFILLAGWLVRGVWVSFVWLCSGGD